MNYYGYLLDPSRIHAATAGRVITSALAALYRQGRFLGGWTHQVDELTYVDENTGDPTRFHGMWLVPVGTGRYRSVPGSAGGDSAVSGR